MLCLILCGYTAYASSPEYQLSGTIREQKNGKALPGVSVYFPEWKTGTISDEAGRYHLHHLPGKGAIVQVTLLGFQTYTEWIDLGKDSIKDFSLAEAVREMHDVVITGLSKSAERNHTPLPVLSVSHTTLMQEASTNIIDALAQQASIAQVTTGAGISKPVIRGLGYNRVVVVQDGVRQEGQQWGVRVQDLA